MNGKEIQKNSTQLLLPNRKMAVRRILLIAAVLFPLTWIVNALLIGNWDLLDNRDAESYRHLREAAVIYVCAVCVVFLLTLLPRTQRFFSWISSWRTVRRCLIVCAWLVTLIALFYGEEDWRGRRAWNNYRDTLTAQGAQLDFKAFVPKPIPDSENFAANPEVESWFAHGTNYTNEWNADAYSKASPMVASDGQSSQPEISDSRNPVPHLTDLVAWKMAFARALVNPNDRPGFKSEQLDPASRAQAAPAVLEALKPIDPHFEELRAASGRPDSLYPVVYDSNDPWGTLLPHLSNIKAVCLRLDLRACAELAAGQTDKAFNDVQLLLRMDDSLKSDPFLLSYLVRAAVMHVAIHPIWEGLVEHKWSDAQLKELQALLARYNFMADLKAPLASERAAGILTADLLEQGKFELNALTRDPNVTLEAAANVFGKIMPHGWYDLEKLNYCRLYTLQMEGGFDVDAKIVYPAKITSNTKAMERAFAGRNPFTTIITRHQLLAAVMLPALGNIPKKGAASQVAADEALLACALERYHLAHGQYPDRLDVLAPEFLPTLPHDLIGGESYKYHRTADSFVLYSVGWNETDDGGQVGMKGKSTDISQGDWVWGMPR
jgi:hypothetical protein